MNLVLNVSRSISIHALRVEGDVTNTLSYDDVIISIHALRVEGDEIIRETILNTFRFLSTPSGWRATRGELTECRA